MVTLTINGREFSGASGQTLLNIAQKAGIDIPTLCHSHAVSDYGACRVCLVEVEKRNRKRLVTACLYPIEEGLKVATDSERVIKVRKTIIELLLARAPDSNDIKELATKYGIEASRFRDVTETSNDNCILCGLCNRVCAEVVGVDAISLVNRGTRREVALPFYDETNDCIACGACSYICPTKAIQMKDTKEIRTMIWPNSKADFKMQQCESCGVHYAPVKQLEYIALKSGLSVSEFNNCPDCRH
ncbi:ferredoxin [Dehalogenimonas lykanthroporepellens BL-DC-9]|jgi:NADH dehydrogenase/NADH:ubiquinone oxidoreductase subunit G|nr:ferredoxin [Dehalogenimonas lykanthroporepellens BL-DC-9]